MATGAPIVLGPYGPVLGTSESGNPIAIVGGTQTWTFTPVDPTNPLLGGTLASGNLYMTRGEESLPTDDFCIVCSTALENVCTWVPVQLDDAHFALRMAGSHGGGLFLTMQPNEPIPVCNQAFLKSADGDGYFQRFTIVEPVPGMYGERVFLAQAEGGAVMGAANPPAAGSGVKVGAVDGSSTQLFWLNTPSAGAPAQIITLVGGLALDLGQPAGGGTAVVLADAGTPAPPSQLWSLSGGTLVNQASGGLATTAADGSLVAAPAVSGGAPSQQWLILPATPSMDDHFPKVQAGQPFGIFDAATGRGLTAALDVEPVGADRQFWAYNDGQLVELTTKQVLTAAADGSILLAPSRAGDPTQTWIFNSKGFMFCPQFARLVLMPTAAQGNAPVKLAPFDPSGRSVQTWVIDQPSLAAAS